MRNSVKKTVFFLLWIFVICSLVKDFEFLILKTDRTFLAENIFCKLFIIAVLSLCLKKLDITWNGIGFKKSGVVSGAVLGVSLGVITFTVSYLIEYFALKRMGLHPEFAFYISNFTISQQNVTGVSVTALVICILGNILNVTAEEGLFRGLILRVGERVLTQKRANLFQAALFGVWHIITVVVWIVEGTIDIPAAIVMAAGYVVLAGILGYEWGLCAALTGTLWAGIFEHFFNNFISNSLHVITENGADEFQIVRIVISNVLSLLLVMMICKVRKKVE